MSFFAIATTACKKHVELKNNAVYVECSIHPYNVNYTYII